MYLPYVPSNEIRSDQDVAQHGRRLVEMNPVSSDAIDI